MYNELNLKPGDKVYASYQNAFQPGTVLSITKETRGLLWWKKTIDVALVEFTLKQKFLWEDSWYNNIVIIRKVPMDELWKVS